MTGLTSEPLNRRELRPGLCIYYAPSPVTGQWTWWYRFRGKAVYGFGSEHEAERWALTDWFISE